MMPPAYVKPYIRRQKNDAADAEAICEAVTRPTMRFVGVRSLKNQAALMRHKAREMLVSQRTPGSDVVVTLGKDRAVNLAVSDRVLRVCGMSRAAKAKESNPGQKTFLIFVPCQFRERPSFI
jgi:hypothetical protein